MNGIDTAVASLLASRVDSLLNIAPGSATTSQTGAAGRRYRDRPPRLAAATPAPPPASAQTALSAVALTLNAIARSGGEATPAVLGQTPIWPAAPALDVEVGGLPLFDTPATPAASICRPNRPVRLPPEPRPPPMWRRPRCRSRRSRPRSNRRSATAVCSTKPISRNGWPASARRRRSPTRRKTGWWRPPRNCRSTGQATPVEASSAERRRPPGHGLAPWRRQRRAQPDSSAAARAMPSIQTAQAARFVAGEVLASSLSDLNGQPAHCEPAQRGGANRRRGLVAELAIDGSGGSSRDRSAGASATRSARHRTVSLDRRSVAGRRARLDHRAGRRRMGPQRRRHGERGRSAVAHASDAVAADARHRRCRSDADRHAARRARAGESGRRGAARGAGRELSAAARGGGHRTERTDDSRDRRRHAGHAAVPRCGGRAGGGVGVCAFGRPRRLAATDNVPPREPHGACSRAARAVTAGVDDFDWDM